MKKIEKLTPELQERVDACKTPEETLALAKEVGYELSEEELDTISGGAWDDPSKQRYCPADGYLLIWQKAPKRGWKCPRCQVVYNDDTKVVMK